MPWHKIRIHRLSLVLSCFAWFALLGIAAAAWANEALQQPEEDTADSAASQPAQSTAQPAAPAAVPDAAPDPAQPAAQPERRRVSDPASRRLSVKESPQQKNSSTRTNYKSSTNGKSRTDADVPQGDAAQDAATPETTDGAPHHDPSVLKRRLIKRNDKVISQVEATSDQDDTQSGTAAPPAARKSSRSGDYVRNPLSEERGLSQTPAASKNEPPSKRRMTPARLGYDESSESADPPQSDAPASNQRSTKKSSGNAPSSSSPANSGPASKSAGAAGKSGAKSGAKSAAANQTQYEPVRRTAKSAARSSSGLKASDPLGDDGSPSPNDVAVRPSRSSGVALKGSQDLSPAPTVTAEAASFNGVTPGKSTLADLTQRWGAGAEVRRSKNMLERQYSVKPFKQIRVTIQNEKVVSIVVQFDKPLATQPLAKQLQIDDVYAIDVADDNGQPLGRSFPERGVMFNYADGTTNVAHVILEPISAEPFLIRAESKLYSAPRRAAADLEYVIQIDPNNDRAHYLLARVLQDHGHAQDALQHIEAAVKRRPSNAAYQLLLAKTQSDLGRYEDAFALAKKLASSQVAGEIKAAALCQCGSLLTFGPTHDCKQAVEYHQSAIKIAESLTNSNKTYVRRAAKEALVDANLGLATDIAGGHYQQKERVVPMWLDRAKGQVDDLIKHDGGDAFLNLRVCRYALAASLMTSGKIDPAPWTSSAQQYAKHLAEDTGDPWRRQRIQWECGLALYNAWQIEVSKGQPDAILTTGQLVVSYLEEGNKERQETAPDSYRLGRLYFRMGAVYAVRRGDHVSAITWFDKAAPLLQHPLPPLSAREEGHHGETFVSMGISYWESGQRDRALKLTQHGVDLMAAAVEEKKLDDRAMAVPYSNLATMFRQLGQEDESKRYVDLSDKSKVRR